MSLFLLLVEKAGAVAATPAGQAVAQGATKKKAPNPMGSLLLFVIIFIGMYLILMIPQQKRSKKEKLMREKIKEGDKVLTNGGIIGTVKKVKEKSLIIETGKTGNQMEVIRTAIGQNITELQREQQLKQK